MHARLRLAAWAFVLTWIPATIVFGIRHGRELRFQGDSATHWGPIGEGIVNYAFITAVPCAFLALIVFVFHAALTERAG